MTEFMLGLRLAAFGLCGVFGTLILFFFSIKLLLKIFIKKPTQEQ